MFIFIGSILVISACYLLPRKVQQFGWLINVADEKVNKSTTSAKALYKVTPNGIGQNETMVIFFLILNVLRGVVLLVFLFLLNVIISYKYHMHLKRKQQRFSNITSNFFLIREPL